MPAIALLTSENEDLKLRLAENERALDECEAHYGAILNSTLIYMCICTVDGVVLDVSAPALQLAKLRIGDSVDQLVWDSPLYAQTPEEAVKIRAAITNPAREVVRYEARILTLEDEWRIFDMVVRPVPDDAGEPRFVVIEARDLTATRAAEERAGRAERMEALGLLTGGIAHDFNNFLTVVIGALDMVARDPERANRERLIEAALQSAQKAEGLNKQLLSFARRAPIAAREMDIEAALHDLQPLLMKAVGEAVDVHVRGVRHGQHVRMEPAQFEAAILNLCVNARDAMSGGGAVDIEARPATAEEMDVAGVQAPAVTIAVTDKGEGIDPEVLPRVFDPFFTTKDPGRGTGLGLSQVYGFARRTGGGVDVISAPGRGSTFKLVLPAAPAPDAGPGARSMPSRPLAIRSVLLVEDDETVAGVASAMLAELGLEVVSALDGPRAQRALEARDFDLLLTDVIMPGSLNGVQLARWARERRPDMQVLLFSGWTADALVTAPPDFAILQKPFDVDALRRAIQDLA